MGIAIIPIGNKSHFGAGGGHPMSVKISALAREELGAITKNLYCSVIGCCIHLHVMIEHPIAFNPHPVIVLIIFDHDCILRI